MRRRSFLGHVAATTAALGWLRATRAATSAGPLDIGSEPQLLLDDWIVAESAGLVRTLHQPAKQGLIKEADGSDWQAGDVYHGNIVCRDAAGRFHMTYRAIWPDAGVRDLHPSIGDDKAHWFRQSIGYATSADGIRWEKPVLGLLDAPTEFTRTDDYPFRAPRAFSKRNNLGCPIEFIHDLHAHGNVQDPKRRFLLQVVRRDDTHPFAKAVESQTFFAAAWPDFAGDPAWKEKLEPLPGAGVSPRGMSTLCGYDHAAQLWFSTHQDSLSNWIPRGGRDVCRFTSPDLVHWSGPELVLPVAADESREPTDHVEYMYLDAYRVGGPKTGAWLGQLLVFHSDRSDPQYQWPLGDGVWRKGTTELRLVLSRDAGRTWQRVAGKQVWLPHSDAAHGYDRLVFGQYPIRVGDELWLYHPASDGDHLVLNRDGTPFEPGFLRTTRTARTTLRWDGYVSLDAAAAPGTLATKPMRFAGNTLVVNAAARRGEVRAELADEAGRPLDGFAFADCEAVRGDGVALPVRWRGGSLQALAGRPVRLRLRLADAAVYAFQFR